MSRRRRPTAAPASQPARAATDFWTPRRAVLAAAAMLLAHYALAVISLVRENATVDEVIHLPAGISYWQAGTFRLYHHNPPLVKLVAALPVLAAGVETGPLYESPYWTSEPPNKAGFAHEFARRNAADYFELFTRARLLMPLFSVAGGMAVFAWSRRLYGEGGGLLSLALWCLCPNLLAHARLVTTDVAATALGVAATFQFWRYLKGPTWGRAVAAGLVLGLAQLTKFSLLLLYGLWPLLWLVRVPGERGRDEFGRWLGRSLVQGVAMVALSILVINLGYGFEGTGRRLGGFRLLSTPLARDRPATVGFPAPGEDLSKSVARVRVNRFSDTSLGWLPVPVPEHYLLGFDDQKLEADGVPLRALRPGAPPGVLLGYPAYLDGELRDRSWPDYYPRAMAYKVPEGTLFLWGLGLVVLGVSPRARAGWADELSVLIPPAVMLAGMTFLTNINLGLRYVLPVFPYLFIATGRLVPWAAGRRGGWWGWGAVGLGLSGTLAATAFISPHYLAYFNLASGGPANGSRHLIDSNLDWGQDLVGLRRWLREHPPGGPVGLAYFGQIPPAIFEARGEGFDWYLPPALPGTWGNTVPHRYRGEGAARSPGPGLYAVSASLMRGLPWRVYDSLPTGPNEQWLWAPFNAEAGAFSYFAGLTPLDHIGHSILIYEVTPEQAAELSRRWERAR